LIDVNPVSTAAPHPVDLSIHPCVHARPNMAESWGCVDREALQVAAAVGAGADVAERGGAGD
jgi:hypothetical protein